MSAVIDKLNSINTKPYIIAEMACSHDGVFSKAEELIQVAVDANADAIQLQLFNKVDTCFCRLDNSDIEQRVSTRPKRR